MKKIQKTNFRVIVEPTWENPRHHSSQEHIEKAYMSTCREIHESIKRHVDNVGSVDIKFDIKEYCSFCLSDWDADKETGEPFCCQKAFDEWTKPTTGV